MQMYDLQLKIRSNQSNLLNMFDRDRAKVNFPWVAYISQPIGHPDVKLILNPSEFQLFYHRWLLENCLTMRYRSLFD
jgi:hypothetical protein